MTNSRALTDVALIAIQRKEEAAASANWSGALSKDYDQALSYNDRQPYGDEQEGLSQVVTSEFADVIESIMPGRSGPFFGEPFSCAAFCCGASDMAPQVIVDQKALPPPPVLAYSRHGPVVARPELLAHRGAQKFGHLPLLSNT
jgi:hypothetical protein